MESNKNKIFFEELVEKNSGIFYKVARTYCYNENDREDLIQEILIQVWRSLKNYNKELKLSTWLYRISLNVAISFLRKNKSKLSVVDIDSSEIIDNSDNKIIDENVLLLYKFINELNDIDKAIMLLYLEDQPHIEISEILGISKTNVGTKISRIKEKLKIKFNREI